MGLRGLRTPARWPALIPAACGRARYRSRALRMEYRHRKMKMRSLAYFAVHPDPSAMHFHQMLGDGQAESRAARLTRARGVHAVKSLEDPRLIHLRNPDPGV